jgi:hypothetical protein
MADCDSLFLLGDCRRSYEDDDSLHTRDGCFLFLFLFFYYFLSIIFFSLALYCTVWRWWLAPELAVMKWIYIYHAGAGGVERTAERGKTKRVCDIRRKEASAWHALRQSRGNGLALDFDNTTLKKAVWINTALLFILGITLRILCYSLNNTRRYERRIASVDSLF